MREPKEETRHRALHIGIESPRLAGRRLEETRVFCYFVFLFLEVERPGESLEVSGMDVVERYSAHTGVTLLPVQLSLCRRRRRRYLFSLPLCFRVSLGKYGQRLSR